MKTVNRKVTYKLYLSRSQRGRMEELHGHHQRLYNSALEHRIYAYRQQKKSLSFQDQCLDLTQLRAADPTYQSINAQSLQVTLKRLDLAFFHFFRRLKQGETPGFPRFKSKERFRGFGYKAHGDGWKFVAGEEGKNGALRLTSVGWVSLRGRPRKHPVTGQRHPGLPKTMELYRRNHHWYASITFAVETPVRHRGTQIMAFDCGLKSYLNCVNDQLRFSEYYHPKYLERSLEQIRALSKKLSRQLKGSQAYQKTKAQLTKVHQKLCNQRQDFTHRLSAQLIESADVLVTEQLNVKFMLEDHQWSHSKGLHRSTQDSAVSGFLEKVRYKAEEAGVVFEEYPTRQLKPTQRCALCWKTEKKTLEQRTHHCKQCGFEMGRDQNAALVMLKQYFKRTGQELALSVERLSRASMKHETPAITQSV